MLGCLFFLLNVYFDIVFLDLATNQEELANLTGQHDRQQFSDFEQNATRLLNILRYMLQQQGEMLNMIFKTLSSKLSSTSVTPCTALIEQPFSCLEELLGFDEKMDRETSNALVNEFTQLGGSDGNWATKRILAYCMTDEVAAKFSWMGRKGKHCFSALKIAKVVKDSE
nr:uncharacterized protein LOC129382594 [Dermacentor andersoni]